MSYQVFARKYRPRTFDDVLGQDHVVQTLRNAIELGRLAHAYLFVGPRGTGKTSTARIFAKALNCPGGPKVDFDPDDPLCREIAEGNSLDVLEIDGASNNGVEQVRELRETVKYAPAHCKFKIYYIDEVHMLSTAAFNALLKTLEEPPPHVKFIFATTEPGKILPTIISRCQRFDLRRIPSPIIAGQLLRIAGLEGVDLDQAAAFLIAKGADGGMRDAQSMLDQLVAFRGNVIREVDVLEIFGFTSMDLIADLAGTMLQRQTLAALERVHEQSSRGKDLVRLMSDLIGYLRNLLVAQIAPAHDFTDLAPELVEKLRAQIGLASPDRLLNLIDHFAETEAKMRWAANKELQFEVGIIKGMQILTETNLSDVIGILREAGQSAGGLPPSTESRGSRAGSEPQRPQAKPAPAPAPAPARAALAPSPSSAAMAERGGGGHAETARPSAPAASPEPGNLRGAALWAAVQREIEATKPIMWGWAKPAVFLEERPRQLVVGFAPADSFFRDSLMRERSRETIEELIRRFGGKSLSLACELREGLSAAHESAEDESSPGLPEDVAENAPAAPVKPPAGDPPRATPEPQASEPKRSKPAGGTAPAAAAQPKAPPVPAPAPALEPAPPPVIDETAFRNDQLIQEALRLFEGELEQPN